MTSVGLDLNLLTICATLRLPNADRLPAWMAAKEKWNRRHPSTSARNRLFSRSCGFLNYAVRRLEMLNLQTPLFDACVKVKKESMSEVDLRPCTAS